MHRHVPRPSALVLITTLALLPISGLRAQDLAISSEAVAIPAEIAEPIRSLLQPETVVVMRGADRLEFWWLKAIALDSTPAGHPSWTNVPDGTLVGAVRLAAPMNDIRGVPMKPGVYTLRFARQPQNGDHMGVSPFREFLLVAPAAEDQSAEPVGYKGAVALAKKTIGRSHPASLSLDPPTVEGGAGRVLTNEAGHRGVTVALPVALQGQPTGTLSFGLILVGRYDH